MAQRHRLGDLQMGEARHDAVRMLARTRDQRRLQGGERPRRPRRRHRAPTGGSRSPPGRCATRRVQPPGGGPISSARRLSTCMWMSSRSDMFGNAASLHIRPRSVQDRRESPATSSAETMPCAASIAACAFDAAISCRHKPLVEGDGGVYLAHDVCGACAEPAAPHAAGVCEAARSLAARSHFRGKPSPRQPVGHLVRAVHQGAAAARPDRGRLMPRAGCRWCRSRRIRWRRTRCSAFFSGKGFAHPPDLVRPGQ
jgi:hypothetical protein